MNKLITNLFLLAATFVCFEGGPASEVSNACLDPSVVAGFVSLKSPESAGTVIIQFKDGSMLPVKGSLEEVRKALTK